MNKFFFLFLIFLFSSVAAQDQPIIHAQYPEGQDFYEGGNKQLYKEIHKILKNPAYEQCLNKEARYTGSVLVREDSRISFIKDFDTATIAANKCAYDLFRKVLPQLKNWKPATIDGKAVTAVSQFTLIPDHLINYYRDGYFYTDEENNAEFPGGIAAFRQEFAKNFNTKVLRSGMAKVNVELWFVINREGQIEDVKVVGDNPRINAEALRSIALIKTPWRPAMQHGIPVRFRFRLPLSFGG